MAIKVDSYLTTVEYDYPSFHLQVKLYLCHLEKPHLELLEHENAKWVRKDELDSLDFLPADRLALDAIKAAI